jgi:hypothetical protein
MRSVREPDDLDAVLDLLHGRWFASDDVLYDPEEGALSISLARRAEEEAPLVVRNLGWIYRRWRVPLRETVLRIHRVRDHQIAEGDWRLEAVGYHGDTVTVYALERPVIRARVDGLALEVQETPNLVGERIESCTLGFLRRYGIRRDR